MACRDVLAERPHFALERPDGLLPRLVIELLGGIPALPLAGRVLVHPAPEPVPQVGGKPGMIEHDVLEVGGEVDLGGLDPGEIPERVGGQRAGAVLHRARRAVLLARRLGERGERLEIELHVGHRAVGQHHPAVRCPGLDRDLADALERALVRRQRRL